MADQDSMVGRRPDFIPREAFRAWSTAGALDKLACVGGITCTSYIGRCDRLGKPIRFERIGGFRRWRMLDIVARARANGDDVRPSSELELASDVARLRAERAALVEEIADRKHELAVRSSSCRLTGATLLSAAEIVSGRVEVPDSSGVYFLLRGVEVVYVGQAQRIFRRVGEHVTTKDFDGFAYIPAPPHMLDKLESLYIHWLRPALNGKLRNQRVISAPLSLERLIGSA